MRAENRARKLRIAAVAPPFSGHLYPLLSLLAELPHPESYEIHVYTGLSKKEIVENAGFSCHALHRRNPYVFERIADTKRHISFGDMLNQFRSYMNIADALTRELSVSFSQSPPDIVLADMTALPAVLACRRLGIPWISTVPTPFAIEGFFDTPAYLGGWLPGRGLLYRLRDAIGRRLIRWIKKTAFFLIRPLWRAPDFTLYGKAGWENLYSPYSIISIGAEALEFRRDFPPQMVWTRRGTAFSEGNAPTLERHTVGGRFLSRFKGAVFVSTGTHLSWAKKPMLQKICRLAAEYPDLCFIITSGSEKDKDKPPQRPAKNVLHYSYLDYEKSLPFVQYAIHHGGAGILYSCIAHGVPALFVPHDYDQFDYAARGQLAGAGLRVSGKSQKALKNRLDQLMASSFPRLPALRESLLSTEPGKVLEEEIRKALEKASAIGRMKQPLREKKHNEKNTAYRCYRFFRKSHH